MDSNNEKVVSIFGIGEVIYIKHEAIIEPGLCIIQKLDDSNIYFKFPDIFTEKNILIGDKIYCQALKENFEYVVYGEITDIEIRPPRFVKVSIDKYNKYKNNRVFARYSVNLQAVYTLENSNEEHYILINNISIIGAAIISKEYLALNLILYIKAKTSICSVDFLEFAAKVVRIIPKDNYNEYGIEIVDINLKNKDILDRVLFNLNSNEESYIEELKKLE